MQFMSLNMNLAILNSVDQKFNTWSNKTEVAIIIAVGNPVQNLKISTLYGDIKRGNKKIKKITNTFGLPLWV